MSRHEGLVFTASISRELYVAGDGAVLLCVRLRSSANEEPTGEELGLHETACPSRDYIRNRHLWGEFVVDAAGVNLLTERHLAHAHDLSNWELEQVTPRRFIVQLEAARGLVRWRGRDPRDRG